MLYEEAPYVHFSFDTSIVIFLLTDPYDILSTEPQKINRSTDTIALMEACFISSSSIPQVC